LALAKANKYQHEQAESYNLSGLIFISQGNYDEALKETEKALTIRQEINDKAGIAESLDNLGDIFEAKGELKEALKVKLQGLELEESLLHKQGTTWSYISLARLYTKLNNYRLADTYLLKAEKNARFLKSGELLLNVLLSSADRSIYYSPAEVNYLFAGPYRPRQLLLYKVAGSLAAALLTAFFMAMAFRQHAAMFLAAYIGLFLGLELLYLFSLSVGLMISTAGALAFDRTRKLVLAGLIGVAVLAFWPVGSRVLQLPAREILDHAMNSPILNLILTPFRPFVMAFTAERIWPDLLGWSTLSLLIDFAIIGFVLVLNSQFLESSAAASERMYARVKSAKRGVARVEPGTKRYDIPMFPFWGGIGPNFWRQVTTASRVPSRLLGLLILYLFPIILSIFSERKGEATSEILGLSISVWAGVMIFAPTIVGSDFRVDLSRMEDLKTLPIRPSRMVIGQILTPVLILTFAAWFVLGCMASAIRSEYGIILTLARGGIRYPR